MKLKYRFLALILSVLILAGITCLNVGATVLIPSGDWVYEKINDNTEFEINQYRGNHTTVYTPYFFNSIPVTSVGTNAFSSNNVVEVVLSDKVHTVKDYAFEDCINLETIVFEGDISNIFYGAFSGCSNLNAINLEDTSISYVASSCFMNCDSLTEVILPDSVESINDSAFAYCDSLSKILIPRSVNSISANAFQQSSNAVIYCYSDSFAHIYAENNSIDYVLIDQIPVETYLLGDVNNDGDVSITDASHIQLFLVGKKECDDKGVIRGDVDLDGELTVVDASLIQRFLAAYKDEKGKYINEVFEFPVSY